MLEMDKTNYLGKATVLLVIPILFLLPGCSEDSLTEKGNKTIAQNMTTSHSNAEVSVSESSPTSASIRVAEASASSPLETDSIRAAATPASAQKDVVVNDTYVDGTVPNKEQIALWTRKMLGDELEVGELIEVHLNNNELAYLSKEVDLWGAILIRPKLREVADLSSDVGKEFQIFDLDGDGVSEIVTTVPGIDQGNEKTSTKQILKLNGWEPVILHQTEIIINRGMRLRGNLEGRDMDVNWKITPRSSNGSPAKLIEEVFINKWVFYQKGNEREDHILKFSNTYQYVNQKMEEIDSTDPRDK